MTVHLLGLTPRGELIRQAIRRRLTDRLPAETLEADQLVRGLFAEQVIWYAADAADRWLAASEAGDVGDDYWEGT